ncbi:MAG: hypothetical protein QW292_01845 [Candidatus Parvarchaeota archaeon]
MSKENLDDLLSKDEVTLNLLLRVENSDSPGTALPYKPAEKKHPIERNKIRREEDVQLRLMLLSDMELGTKLSDPVVTYNIGEIIKDYEKRIDLIIVNGSLAYVPDRYSRWRGERLDLLEDNLKVRYGEENYKVVKEGGSKNNSVDDLKEAARLARIQMENVVKQANAKNIPIAYTNGNTDYRNIKMIMEALEKLGRKNRSGKNGSNKDKKDGDELDRLLRFMPEGYTFKASDWKTIDKEGIKDKAISIYSHMISAIFSDGDVKNKVKFYKRFENFLGSVDKKLENLIKGGGDTAAEDPEEFVLNGMKIKVFDSIDGLTTGLTEGVPSKMHEKNKERYAAEDKKMGRLADLYITFGSMNTEATAVDFGRNERPVYLFNQSPLLDVDKLLRLRAAFNKTRISKALNKGIDSSISIITIYKDGRFETDRLTVDGIRKKVNISELESKLKDGSMHEIVATSDWHIGSQYAMYDEIAYLPDIIKRLTSVPKGLGKKHLFDLGDNVDGGKDKLERTRMQVTFLKPPEELIPDLEKDLTIKPEELSNIGTEAARLKIINMKNKLISTLEDLMYGNPTIEIGSQLDRLGYYIKPISRLFDDSYLVDGNHFQSATGNGSEGRAIASIIRSETEVKLADEYLSRNELPKVGNYNVYLLHTAGYRGGLDAATTLLDEVVNMGLNVELAAVGDVHEWRVKYGIQSVGGAWRSIIATTSAALQRPTPFERQKIHKLDYTKGISMIYLPADENIGTMYTKTVFIPAQTIDRYMKEGGGTRIGRVVNEMFDSLDSLEHKAFSPT